MRWSLTGDGSELLSLDHVTWWVLAPVREVVHNDVDTATWVRGSHGGRLIPTSGLSIVVDTDVVLQGVDPGTVPVLLAKGAQPELAIYPGAPQRRWTAGATSAVTLRFGTPAVLLGPLAVPAAWSAAGARTLYAWVFNDGRIQVRTHPAPSQPLVDLDPHIEAGLRMRVQLGQLSVNFSLGNDNVAPYDVPATDALRELGRSLPPRGQTIANPVMEAWVPIDAVVDVKLRGLA